MNAMSSVNESDSEPMSTDMLEDVRDGSQSRPIINRIYACYKIRDNLNKGEKNGKEHYYQHGKWVKFCTEYLRLLLMNFQKHYQFLVNQAQKFLT